MNTFIKQDRITLRNLQVAEFASEETLCFTATVVFDGTVIGEAHNQGHGGQTFIHASGDKRAKMSEAEKFAESLPPHVCPNLPLTDGNPFVLNITLDYLIDDLANAMHMESELRASYSRRKNRVMFIKDGELLSLAKFKLPPLSERPAFFASLRKSHGPEIVILAELPPDEAFALWKQHVYSEN